MSARIKVRCEVDVYEVSGSDEDTRGLDMPKLVVESHYRDALVVLRRGEHDAITVVASDLIAAIQNATRTR